MARDDPPGSGGAGAGGAPALDVFALRDSVVDEYERFATSFTTIRAPDIREQVEAIYAENRYWPEPLIQINPSYKRSTDLGALVAAGVLDPGCADVFRANGRPLSLYKHQEQAVALAAAGESFMVTTGTGSGKSLCFFIPIVNHVLRARRTNAPRSTSAVVVYPMNALANSQMEELGKFIEQAPGDRPITLDCGDDGPPYLWDPERRFRLRCEIDAAFFHLYGVSRDAAWILDTFPVLRRSEEREHGEYRTKRVVLETHDALAAAAAEGIPCRSPLEPPRRAA